MEKNKQDLQVVRFEIENDEYFFIRDKFFDENMEHLISMYENGEYETWQEIEDFICEHFTEFEFYDTIILN